MFRFLFFFFFFFFFFECLFLFSSTMCCFILVVHVTKPLFSVLRRLYSGKRSANLDYFMYTCLNPSVIYNKFRAIKKCILGQKRVFGWTAKSQISLTIRTVWSGPSLSANGIIGYYRMSEWRSKVRIVLYTCTWQSESTYLTPAWGHFFFTWTGPYTVELQWLEHLWDHRKLFDMGGSSHWGLIMAPIQEAK